MSYSFEILEDEKVIFLRYDQSTTYQDRIDALDQIIQHLKEDLTLNILVDARSVEDSLTAREQLDLGTMLAKNNQYFQQNRTAVLKKREVNPVILGKAYIDGHVTLAEFQDDDEALKWLSGKLA
ncbi:MAG: hypothetical protein ACQCXQ_01345 [Verrucomicrobiales bacterium]|nr:hypothetical protein [Verrucomicrobiota bacterium JB025]